jgi:hypothetical protein
LFDPGVWALRGDDGGALRQHLQLFAEVVREGPLRFHEEPTLAFLSEL